MHAESPSEIPGLDDADRRLRVGRAERAPATRRQPRQRRADRALPSRSASIPTRRSSDPPQRNLPPASYSAAQATRGEAVYGNTCGACHQPGSLVGQAFVESWSDRRVYDFYALVRGTMPLDNPGGLKDQEYLDVIAYLLKANHAPAGADSLAADTCRASRAQDRRSLSVVSLVLLEDHADGDSLALSRALRVSLLALSAGCARDRSRGPGVVGDDAAASTTCPTRIHVDTTWAKLPPGRTWGSTSAVAIDRDGKSIWMAERCGTNSCATSTLDPVIKFDANGNVVAHFGGGHASSPPHGIFVDKDGNIWVVDCACTGGGGRRGGAGGAPAGTPGSRRRTRRRFDRAAQRPSDLRVQPRRQAAAHARQAGRRARPGLLLSAERDPDRAERRHLRRPRAIRPRRAARHVVYKFSKDGTLIKAWGQLGNGPDDFDQPHALAMDSKGRLFVGDRGNNRIKIFDQDGKLLDTWYQFSRPSGIFIDAQDNIYVADSESGSVARARTDWKRGIRIGSAKDGSVK